MVKLKKILNVYQNKKIFIVRRLWNKISSYNITCYNIMFV